MTVLTVCEHEVRKPDGEKLLGPLSFTVAVGERLGITGPSGCGKSTLLRDICRAVKWTRDCDSTIRVYESDLDYLGQRDALFPWYSPRQTISALSKTAAEDPQAEAFAKALNLGDKLDLTESALSGGERQRAGLWTALCQGKRFLILDEPYTALDLASKYDALDLTSQWLTAGNRSLLVVSHDFHVLSFLCDRILHLDVSSQTIATVSDHSAQRCQSLDNYLALVDKPDGPFSQLLPLLGKRSSKATATSHQVGLSGSDDTAIGRGR